MTIEYHPIGEFHTRLTPQAVLPGRESCKLKSRSPDRPNPVGLAVIRLNRICSANRLYLNL